MTSVVFAADIEDALVSGGVRDPFARARIMRMIKAYLIQKETAITPAPAADPYGYLQPGGIDSRKGVARCISCRQVRELALFGESGEKRMLTCMACTGEVLHITCTKCGVQKRAEGGFSHDARSPNGWRTRCKTCESGRMDKCARCLMPFRHRQLTNGKCRTCLRAAA
jgi:hypothetical protein